ncbi:class I SAM-dependent methyltransferase [Demequina muriae]|uniref:Methyltransferase domain-containing protein n=1 Tax=Demequina muriae TaxID=3051664 RepID=A0ABT8GEQ5_9MICO|nr:methyltransferase domain-containing protein [Demequina sp. EGI L300058]MDN4479918.1 methyltransferase domain-containing protein [Demequina sp. EGI L300058]
MTVETIDATKLEAFMGRAVTDLAAAESSAATYLGDRLGLYRAMASGRQMTAGELAALTGTHERLVLEWLRNQAAGGYIEHEDGRFTLPPEHAAALADEESPYFLGGFFEIIAAVWADTELLEGAFRGDGALAWGAHDPRLYRGVERFYGATYRSSLVQAWLPALDGVTERLEAGATVADIGCGYGLATTLMAAEFPRSTFVGYDSHGASIEAARDRAHQAGVTDRVRYEELDAVDLPARGFDLACFFDALHDMGDPIGAAAAARRALAEDGVLMVVEPRAGDRLEDNVGPIGRAYYAGSTLLCTPGALAQGGQHVLGAQAGPAALTEVLRAAGFSRVRVAAETPFNLILEARA